MAAAVLVAPLALLVAYVVAQRSRRKYALRFTSVDLLASVAPRRPGWQRHVSAALMLAAVVGARRSDSRDRRRPRRSHGSAGTILLAIDTSGSMAATDVAPEPARRRAGRGAAVRRRVCPRA